MMTQSKSTLLHFISLIKNSKNYKINNYTYFNEICIISFFCYHKLIVFISVKNLKEESIWLICCI